MKTLVAKIHTNELLLVHLGCFNKKCSNTALFIENYKKGTFEKVEMIDFLKESNSFIDTYLYVGMKQNDKEEFRILG